MNWSIGEFGKAAQKLSRNPLGIIALFIVLVYGIAALVLGLSSNNLQPNERLPLIYFLVFFPVIVLIAFYRLVSNHHMKLYAPIDFQDKEGFFRALTPLEQKQKIDEEMKSIEEETKAEDKTPPVPKKDNSNLSEMESAGILKTISKRHTYVLAEELAFREIESEFKVSVHRQVAIGRGHSIDGLFRHHGKPKAIEIKFMPSIQYAERIIKIELDKFLTIPEYMKPEFSILLVVVVASGLKEETLNIDMDKLLKIAEDANLSVELRFYDFDELKEKYGFSEAVTEQKAKAEMENK